MPAAEALFGEFADSWRGQYPAMIASWENTWEYRYETAGFQRELSKCDSTRLIDILVMFRIITFSIDRLGQNGTPVELALAANLEFQGLDHNDALEGQIASYLDFSLKDDRWT